MNTKRCKEVSYLDGDEKDLEKIERINTPRCLHLLEWLTAIQNTNLTDHKQEFYKKDLQPWYYLSTTIAY